MTEYPKEFLDYVNSIQSKRPRTIIQHILHKGSITSEEIKEIYGYNHPPRAVRDVRELGIPIVTKKTKGADGRSIAIYTFGDPNDLDRSISKSTGRTVLSKNLKNELIKKYGSICFIYLEPMDESELQVDHRIPYEIRGECDDTDLDNFMLVCRSANREKSWSCEHCSNWIKKDVSYCECCYWAHPENYTHIADRKECRISIMFSGEEILDYDEFVAKYGPRPEEVIKKIIHEKVKKDS